MEIILEARNLKKHYEISKGLVLKKKLGILKAVDGIDFSVFKGDVFGIVGESGSGKSTTLKMILLMEGITSGELLFENKNISKMNSRDLRYYRRSVHTMLQDPYCSLNPYMKIRDVIAEPIEVNLSLSRKEVDEKVEELLNEVELDPNCASLYPHEFSGGQRQRIALARAIALRPKLILLDEPVSALDVSVQAQLMNLLMDIQRIIAKGELTYMIVAHDLAVVRYMCNRIMVMYLGKIVEYGDSETIFNNQLHPYTKALFASTLPVDPFTVENGNILTGEIPSPINRPSGCSFHPRCIFSKDICREVEPSMTEVANNHQVKCHFWRELAQ